MTQKIRIGDLLVTEGLLSEQQLQACIAKQRLEGGRLGKLFVSEGYVDENQVLGVLAKQLAIPYIDLTDYEFNEVAIRLLPEVYARRFRALVLLDKGDKLLVGMADPLDIFAFDELGKALKRPFDMAIVKEASLLHSIDMLYRHTEEISQFAGELSDELGQTIAVGDEDTLTADDAPVVKLLQTLFDDAVKMKASDIHIEPDRDVLRIRQRVDGVLQEQVMHETHIAGALAQRLKLMANLNIAERRLPQDGRFNMDVRDKSFDVRISTMPTQYGESVVMRLLDQAAVMLNLDSLKMPAAMLKTFRGLVQRPHGMVLVTGPTGSGKTTTLYGALNELNITERKIITVEDPVEYHLPRVNQVQVNDKIDLDFARVLRSTLRQDPDILLVGEIRDHETAAIALRAAMTGHLVLATLHTNDAASSAMRLIDIGVPGYLVAAALQGVLAQRLVRCLCEYCKVPYTLTPEEQQWLAPFAVPVDAQFYQAKGCTHCNRVGYLGRQGVFELLRLDGALRAALRKDDAAQFSELLKQRPACSTLADNAVQLAATGVTTLSEVLKIVSDRELEHEAVLDNELVSSSTTDTDDVAADIQIFKGE